MIHKYKEGMDITYHAQFRKHTLRLPYHIKRLVAEKISIFIVDPFDPKLKNHVLKGRLKDWRAISINNEYRIIFKFLSGSKAFFYKIGTHEIYKH